jgi:hypothetical protein
VGEKSWYKLVFKVAVEVLVGELWWVVAEQMMALGSLTRFVREVSLEKGGEGEKTGEQDDDKDEIWWSPHRPPRLMRRR